MGIRKICFYGMLLFGICLADNCFLLKEGDVVLLKEGSCDIEHSAGVAFKLSLLVMALDTGIIKNTYTPRLTSPKKDLSCSSHLTPMLWMKKDCPWYDREIVSRLGLVRINEYLQSFLYPAIKNPADLVLSPWHVMNFLNDLINHKLPVSAFSVKEASKMIFIKDLVSWRIFGLEDKHWFIGWVEKGHRKLIFVEYTDKDSSYLKNDVFSKLGPFLEDEPTVDKI